MVSGCALAALLRVVVERVIASERPQDTVVHKEDHSCLCSGGKGQKPDLAGVEERQGYVYGEEERHLGGREHNVTK